MKCIIAGSRSMTSRRILDQVIRESGFEDKITEVICGGARGADHLGAKWARARGISIRYFKAEWLKYGEAAGPIRNSKMAHYADALILVWDGFSFGSKDMLAKAEDNGLLICQRQFRKREKNGNFR